MVERKPLGLLEMLPAFASGRPAMEPQARLACLMRDGIELPRRTKKRVPQRDRIPLEVGVRVNQGWALDVMHDALYDGRRFRTLNVIDEAKREALTIEIGTSSQTKAPTLSASTEFIGTRCSMPTRSSPSSRYSTLPKSGCANTTSHALMKPWMGCLRGASCPRLATVADSSNALCA